MTDPKREAAVALALALGLDIVDATEAIDAMLANPQPFLAVLPDTEKDRLREQNDGLYEAVKMSAAARSRCCTEYDGPCPHGWVIEVANPAALTETAAEPDHVHKCEWLDGVPTGWCLCGKPWPHVEPARSKEPTDAE